MLNLRPDAARRAVTNLVDNARRHAHQVYLSVEPWERSVQVVVDDDGPGISLPTVGRAYSALSRAAPSAEPD